MPENTAAEQGGMRPTVSVIIPIFNVEKYLAQCLDSIRAQDEPLQVLCVNDGSTDGSKEIIERYVELDSRFVLVDKPNGGYGNAVNVGLDNATGGYISIIEPDDWIEPGMYTEMIDFALSFDEPIDIIKTPYWRIWMPDTPEQQRMHCSYNGRIHPKTQPFTIDDPGAVHLLVHHPSIWSAIYRRAFLEEFGIRMREYPGAGWADNPWLLETYLQARTIVYYNKGFYNYREDTPTKATTFALKNTLLPLERWNDMMDIIENLGVTNEGVLRSHNNRGFTYLSGILEEVPIEREDVYEAAVHMFERMDADLVLTDTEVSPGMKKLFMELRGLPPQHINHLPYFVGLAKQGVYTLWNTGATNALRGTARYFRTHAARVGLGPLQHGELDADELEQLEELREKSAKGHRFLKAKDMKKDRIVITPDIIKHDGEE